MSDPLVVGEELDVGPGPDDCLPCPSESARRRHLARSEQCETCDVSVDGPPTHLYRNWRTE